MKPNAFAFTGTPTDIGQQVWSHICLPVIGTASKQMPPQALGQLYGGFIMAAIGAMTADFGHEQALSFAREIMAAAERIAPTMEDGTRLQ